MSPENGDNQARIQAVAESGKLYIKKKTGEIRNEWTRNVMFVGIYFAAVINNNIIFSKIYSDGRLGAEATILLYNWIGEDDMQ